MRHTACFFALALGLASAGALQAQPLAELLRASDQAGQKGDQAGAEEILTRAARLYPRSPLPQYRLGRLHAERGQIFDAILHLRAALELAPKHVPSRTFLGQLYSQAGNFSLAVPELEQVLRLRPGDPEASLLLAGIYRSQEATARALAVLEAAQRAHPQSPGILSALAHTQAELGQTEKAKELYQAALRADPRFAKALLELGKLMASQPELLAGAHEYLERHAKLEPGSAAGHLALGALYQQRNELETAAEHLRRSIELDGASPEAHFRLATVLTRLGQLDAAAKARAHFEELRQRDDQRRQEDLAFTTAFRTGQNLTRSNRLREATAKFEEALAIRPDSDTAHAMLAKVLFSMRLYEDAQAHSQGAIARSPANGEYRYVHGLILLARNALPAAENELSVAGRLAPVIGDIFNQLGRLAAQRGNWSEAAAQYQRAVAAEPDAPAFHLHLAEAYEALGRQALAEKHRKRYRALSKPGIPATP